MLPLWLFLKTIPLRVWATIGAVVLALILLGMWSHSRYKAGYEDATAVYQEREQKAALQALAKERELAAKYAEQSKALIKAQEENNAKLNKTIADLRSGTVRLRNKFKCPAASPGSPGSDAGTEAGLSTEDAEFLVREASRADSIVNQLTTCQAIVKEIYDQ